MEKPRLIRIYGAGISGLLIAHYLNNQQYPFEIYDPNGVGGKISTLQTDFGLVESAANAIVNSPDVNQLINELGLKPIQTSQGLKRFVFRDGKMSTVPIKFTEFIKLLFNLNKIIPGSHEQPLSLYQFFEPLLGHDFSEDILSAILSGIYASSSHDIDARFLIEPFPENQSYASFLWNFFMQKKSQKIKAVSISFENGMQQLIDQLASAINVSTSPPKLDKKYINVICTNAHQAAEILQNDSPKLSTLLKKVDYLPIASTTVFTKDSIKPLIGSFGCLFPKSQGFKHLGILNNRDIFPGRVQNRDIFSYTFIGNDTNNLMTNIEFDFKKLTNKRLCPLNIYQNTWEQGLPRYNAQHFQNLLEINSHLNSSMYLFGNYMGSISLRSLVSKAKKLTTTILENG